MTGVRCRAAFAIVAVFAASATLAHCCEDAYPRPRPAPVAVGCGDAVPPKPQLADRPVPTFPEDVYVYGSYELMAPMALATPQYYNATVWMPVADPRLDAVEEPPGPWGRALTRTRHAAGFAADIVTTVHPVIRAADYLGIVDRHEIVRKIHGD